MIKNIKSKISIVIIVSTLFFASCEKSDNYMATGNDEIHLFIWRAMNNYYLWQPNVPDLSDTRFTNIGQLYSEYSNFSSPRDVFESLLYQPGVVDRFSWIVDDYVALENSFQGINLSNGMEFGLVRYDSDASKVFGYVRYVIPGSDAEAQNIERGMLFSEVDGVQLTESNYRDLLFDDSTNYSITLADFNGGNPLSNSTIISLTKTQLQENPVAIVKTIQEGNNTIGYLLYNQFSSSFDSNLNAAFATFQSENITDLIIDLRYNGGGSINTATYLGAMVTGQFNGQLFSKEQWNTKIQELLDASIFENNFTNEIVKKDQNQNIILQEPINSLNLNRVYFITTGSSASASELVMNSLSSYINVSSVGKKTVGKVQGSVTLYDSDNYTRTGENLASNHNWALQPLVLEIKNKDNFNEPDGITPTVELSEDFGNLGELGERSDPLLDRTIVLIATGSRSLNSKSNDFSELKQISNSKENYPSGNNMFIELKNKKLNKKVQ
ncbi:S41 family peptidase [Flavobacteriaceae bacterium]|nr:S41 family peptidase [Flavobacteriaceae bacterium]MDB2413326.1 S41 family peptidase [Flavobacteriaceae bacterium]